VFEGSEVRAPWGVSCLCPRLVLAQMGMSSLDSVVVSPPPLCEGVFWGGGGVGVFCYFSGDRVLVFRFFVFGLPIVGRVFLGLVGVGLSLRFVSRGFRRGGNMTPQSFVLFWGFSSSFDWAGVRYQGGVSGVSRVVWVFGVLCPEEV